MNSNEDEYINDFINSNNITDPIKLPVDRAYPSYH